MLICGLLTVATTSKAAQLQQAPNPLDAPLVTPIPRDLPPTTTDEQGAVTFPPSTAAEVLDRLRLLDAYAGPDGVCQKTIDANRRYLNESCKLKGDLADLECTAQVDAAERWQWYHVLMMAVSVGALGFAAGATAMAVWP